MLRILLILNTRVFATPTMLQILSQARRLCNG